MTGTLSLAQKPDEASPKTGALADFFPYQLSLAANAVSDLVAMRYRDRFGLKVSEWRIIAVLGDARAGQADCSMTQADLCEATLMDKVVVNRASKVLEARGFIARRPHHKDARSHLLALTQEGVRVHGEVMPLALATQAELLADFEPAEIERLRYLLGAMQKRAQALSSPVNP